MHAPRDSKHIFSEPITEEIKPPTFFNNWTQNSNGVKYVDISSKNNIEGSIGESILKLRQRRKNQAFTALFITFISTVLGYSIGYKVLYLEEESFLPLYPSKRVHPLNDEDLIRLNIEDMKKLANYRVLERLSMHPLIKEDFGVPLRTSSGDVPIIHNFEVWCKDQEPCVTGIILRPANKTNSHYHGVYFYDFFHWQWGFFKKPLRIFEELDRVSRYLGLSTSDFFQQINQEVESGDFKYEISAKLNEDHIMHIWFLGEIQLDPNSLVVFNGKYHSDVKLEQVDLLRKEEGKLVRYVLYKGREI